MYQIHCQPLFVSPNISSSRNFVINNATLDLFAKTIFNIFSLGTNIVILLQEK